MKFNKKGSIVFLIIFVLLFYTMPAYAVTHRTLCKVTKINWEGNLGANKFGFGGIDYFTMKVKAINEKDNVEWNIAFTKDWELGNRNKIGDKVLVIWDDMDTPNDWSDDKIITWSFIKDNVIIQPTKGKQIPKKKIYPKKVHTSKNQPKKINPKKKSKQNNKNIITVSKERFYTTYGSEC